MIPSVNVYDSDLVSLALSPPQGSQSLSLECSVPPSPPQRKSNRIHNKLQWMQDFIFNNLTIHHDLDLFIDFTPSHYT